MVVQAALGLADAGGTEALTLPQVARALGCTTMSLYRHVGSKDEFLALVVDAAIGPPPDTAAATGWRDGLRRWATSERAVYQRRPWVARMPITGPPLGPNQVGWMEAALGALRGTGLHWGEKLGMLMLVSGYVRQSALLEADLAGGEAAEAARRYPGALARAIDRARFPETAQLLASGVLESSRTQSYDDGDFQFGLDRILDGADMAVRRRRPDRPGRPARRTRRQASR
jgi:AcrR family transcriptional regulator